MDAAAAGRLSLARPSRLSPERNNGHSHMQNSGWVAASLLDSYTWNSSYSPLIDFSAAVPRSRFLEEHMVEDGERVNRLFEKAPQAGIQIQWRSISGEELSMLILSGHYIAIALVDKHKLRQPWLEELCLSDCCGINSGYTDIA